MTDLPVAVDSNLLLLLIVGMTDRDLVLRHKRLKEFTLDDYDLLQEQLTVATEIIITPNTLTETSNLIDHIAEPARSRIYSRFRDLIRLPEAKEIHVNAISATDRHELNRLGLTDCALLELCAKGIPVLTVDVKLFLAVIGCGHKAINFNHLRGL